MGTLVIHGSRTEDITLEALRSSDRDLAVFEVDTIVPREYYRGNLTVCEYETYLTEQDLFAIDAAALDFSKRWFHGPDGDLSQWHDISLGCIYQDRLIMRIVPLLKNIAVAKKVILHEKPDRILLGRGVSLVPWAWKRVASEHGIEVVDLGETPYSETVALENKKGIRRLRRRLAWGRHILKKACTIGLRTRAKHAGNTQNVVVYGQYVPMPEMLSRLQAQGQFQYVPMDPHRRDSLSEHVWYATERKLAEIIYHRRWETLAQRQRDDPELSYMGIPICDYLSSELEEWFCVELPALAADLSLADRFLKRKRPVFFLILGTPYGGRIKGWSLVARKLGIPVVCVQHENMLPGYLKYYPDVPADFVLAWGKLSKRWFVNKGVQESMVYLAAPEKFQRIATTYSDKSEDPLSTPDNTERMKSADAKDAKIIFAPGYWGPWTAWHSPLDFERAFHTIAWVAAQLPQYHFLVKFHPSSSHPVHEGEDTIERRTKWLRGLNLNNLDIAPFSSSLFDYLDGYDILVTTLSFSTTVIEALLHMKPVVVLDTTGKSDLLPEASESGSVIVVRGGYELVQVLRQICENRGYRESLLCVRERFLSSALTFDENPADTIHNISRQVLRQRNAVS